MEEIRKRSTLNPCASLPNIKFCHRSTSPSFMLQKSAQRDKIMENKWNKPPFDGGTMASLKLPKLFSELALQADEELRNLIEMCDQNRYGAFLCHNSEHNKDDLTAVDDADRGSNRHSFVSQRDCEEVDDDDSGINFNKVVKSEKSLQNGSSSEDTALIFGSRLIDPVAWTLNLREKAMVVQFENPAKLFNQLNIPPASSASSKKTCSRDLNYRQFAKYTDEADLSESLCVKQEDFNAILPQLIPCVGCRNSMEKLYNDLSTMNHSALFPFVVNKNFTISLHRSFLTNPRALYKLLITNGARVKVLLENLTKCRKNKRCNLHSLDVHVPKNKIRWEDLWPLMSEDCADECCVVETEHLLEMLESYLQKHKFCTDCRTKIMKAYHLLTGEADKTKETGYNANLYQGLRYCSTECHLHLRPCAAYLNMLMDRAEPELLGGFKERHAKTLEIAQGEVLTCIGLYIYDRLHRLSMAMKTLQNTFQLLYCSGIAALSTAFQKSVESKNGLLDDSLEKICAELQDSTVKPVAKKTTKKSKSKNVNKEQKKSESCMGDLCRQCLKKAASEQTQRRYHLSRSLSPVNNHSRLSSKNRASGGCSPDDLRRSVGEEAANGRRRSSILITDRPSTVNGDERFCANKNCLFSDNRSSSSGSPSPAEKIVSSPSVINGEDVGYLSSITNPTDRKSTISSDALSIESDRSEMLDTLSESSPILSTGKCYVSTCKGIFSAGSLTEMLKLSDETCACGDDGIDSFDDDNDEGLGISKEEIEWFHRNRSIICQERQLLRAKLLENFENMQIRMSTSK